MFFTSSRKFKERGSFGAKDQGYLATLKNLAATLGTCIQNGFLVSQRRSHINGIVIKSRERGDVFGTLAPGMNELKISGILGS